MEQGIRSLMCFPIGVEMKKNHKEHIADINSEALFADGFDDAIIGYDAVGFRVVYDYDKCSDILMKRDGMTKHEAHEFMEFNVVGAFVGDFTPLFIHTL